MGPPSDSLAAHAARVLEERFPERSGVLPVIVLVECAESVDCGVLVPEVGSLLGSVARFAREYNESHNNVVETMDWFAFNGTLDRAKKALVNANATATFSNILVRASNSSNDRKAFVARLEEHVAGCALDRSLFRAGVTGMDALNGANEDHAKAQIMRVDAVTVPLAMCVLGAMLGSWRLLVLSFLTMVLSVLTSFAVMTVAIEWLGAPEPESTTAQLMEVLCIALGIDYSLFTLRRFRDELLRGASAEAAVYTMMYRAGHVVLMSGLTLLLVMLAFLLMPDPTIRMDGVSCAVGIALCVVVHLSLTPAVLYEFPDFFSGFGCGGCCGLRCDVRWGCFARAAGYDDAAADRDADGRGAEPSQQQQRQQQQQLDRALRVGVNPKYKTLRFRVARFVTAYPNNVVVLVLLYLAAVPLALQIRNVHLDENILHLLPRNGDEMARLTRMYAEFPGGTFAPFDVLLAAPRGPGGAPPPREVLWERLWPVAQRVSERLVAETVCGEEGGGVGGPAWSAGRRVARVEAAALLEAARSQACEWRLVEQLAPESCGLAREYQFLWRHAVNGDGDSMLVTAIVPFFPFDSKITAFIARTNAILAEEAAKANANFSHEQHIELLLTGFVVGPEALRVGVLAVFPWMCALTLGCIFFVLSMMLKSFFVPVRLALTLLLPLGSVFGIAVLVYQDGILNWTGLQSVHTSEGFFWSLPILVVTVSAGLVLDYDIYLISAIMEHRQRGYDIRAATCKAVGEAGPTISAAGIIMTAVFSGLLISDQTLVDQSGWLLSTTVLVDTLLVNTVLVPALVSLGDSVAWYPTVMPSHALITLDSPEFSEQDPSASSSAEPLLGL
jgi:uncharacterized membrane protein YdfJ with MMPL/SSD domain